MSHDLQVSRALADQCVSSVNAIGDEKVLINLSVELFGSLSALRMDVNEEIEVAPNQITE